MIAYLDRLEATIARFTEISLKNDSRYDEAIARLAREMFELRGIMTNLATQQQRTDLALESYDG